MSINRTLLSSVQSSASAQQLRSPHQIKSKGTLSAKIKEANKADKQKAHQKAKASKSSAKETSKVVAAQEKKMKADTKKDSKSAKPRTAASEYPGRKNIVDTPHGPAVDLDAVEKSRTKKPSDKKVPVKPKGGAKKK